MDVLLAYVIELEPIEERVYEPEVSHPVVPKHLRQPYQCKRGTSDYVVMGSNRRSKRSSNRNFKRNSFNENNGGFTSFRTKIMDITAGEKIPHWKYVRDLKRVQANCNRAKIFTEKEVTNFTSQRLLSPFMCEYPTLERDSSPIKKRPEPKPILEVKRSLLSFEKAQDHKKWSRKLEYMINFPKPAKPVLHLPYLEDLGFTSNQPQKWQPGDLLTGLHQLAKPISFKKSLQLIQIGSIQSYLWEPEDHLNHPEDIINGQEEFYKFIQCTCQHRIRRIHINSNLPYLEALAFKLQQLFFFEFMHDIKPSKPSRRSQGSSLIPLNRPDIQLLIKFTCKGRKRGEQQGSYSVRYGMLNTQTTELIASQVQTSLNPCPHNQSSVASPNISEPPPAHIVPTNNYFTMNELTNNQDSNILDSNRRIMIQNLNYDRENSTLVRDLRSRPSPYP
ncbi:hypothetical protein YC2023_041274 [Brassica napus]